MRIAGSTVLLTGATGGLGQAIARALAERGASLTLTGRREAVLEPLAQELGARALAVDLCRREALDSLVEEVGEVDILIANAALPGSGRLSTFTIEQVDRVLEVNLRAPIALAHALLPAMTQRGHGQLVFISSIAGKVATAGTSVYNATKFGMRGFATALRAELHGSGVGVSTIFPGFISDAGMYADTNVALPPGVGTRTPEDVARGVIAAIEHDRGEVDVAPLSLRASTVFAPLAPDVAARLTRMMGGDRVAEHMGEAQMAKRD
ncbi:MAG: SDR family NAD(P)-dependent oxidoreductase [Solirubrobacterales bacterium]|nr:SDR family NAD(P)-dependent oxidoreductase [Solirubrobacterales bacterium]